MNTPPDDLRLPPDERARLEALLVSGAPMARSDMRRLQAHVYALHYAHVRRCCRRRGLPPGDIDVAVNRVFTDVLTEIEQRAGNTLEAICRSGLDGDDMRAWTGRIARNKAVDLHHGNNAWTRRRNRKAEKDPDDPAVLTAIDDRNSLDPEILDRALDYGRSSGRLSGRDVAIIRAWLDGEGLEGVARVAELSESAASRAKDRAFEKLVREVMAGLETRLEDVVGTLDLPEDMTGLEPAERAELRALRRLLARLTENEDRRGQRS